MGVKLGQVPKRSSLEAIIATSSHQGSRWSRWLWGWHGPSEAAMKAQGAGGSEGQQLLSVTLESCLTGQASAVNLVTFE